MACLPSEVVFRRGHGWNRCPCQRWLWLFVFVPRCLPGHRQDSNEADLALASWHRPSLLAALRFSLTLLIMLILPGQMGPPPKLEDSYLSEKALPPEKRALRLVLVAVFRCSSPLSALHWYTGIVRKTFCFSSPAKAEQAAPPYQPS